LGLSTSSKWVVGRPRFAKALLGRPLRSPFNRVAHDIIRSASLAIMKRAVYCAFGAQKSGFVISDQKVRRSARNLVAIAATELTKRFMVIAPLGP
jgi:hypothetical protein